MREKLIKAKEKEGGRERPTAAEAEYAMSAKRRPRACNEGPAVKGRCYVSPRARTCEGPGTTLVADTKSDSTGRRLKRGKESSPEGRHPLLRVVWLWQGDSSTTPQE